MNNSVYALLPKYGVFKLLLICSFMFVYQDLKEKENDELDIQLKVFDENKEDDLTELSHRLNDIRAEMEYPFDKPQKSFCMYCEKGICG